MTSITTKTQQPVSGRVVSCFGNLVAVETDDGQVFQCHLHRNQELPVVGDRVRWQIETGKTGVIVAIEQRKTVLLRGNGRGKTQAVAANIDAMIIVMAPPPVFSGYLVDRYLVAAELLEVPSILALNKTDLLNNKTKKVLQQCLQSWQDVSCPVVFSSIYLRQGLQALADCLAGKTSVLVGPSGVGKSSIIAALSKEDIRVGDVSRKGVGKHTTTATRLYHLPGGGALIDSPGIREFHLWSVTREDIIRAFREFRAFSGVCKFRDCLHIVEPGCAVQTAVADGKISAQRYASYQQLIQENGSRKSP